MTMTAEDEAMWIGIIAKVREVYPRADGLDAVRALKNLGPEDFDLDASEIEWLIDRDAILVEETE